MKSLGTLQKTGQPCKHCVASRQLLKGQVFVGLVANGVGYSLANVRPRAPHSLDGKRIINVPLKGRHRPMKLGLAWIKDQQPRRVVETFMERCRSCMADGYIPGMAAEGAGPVRG